MFETFDIYCERMSSAFWAEPVNALTNSFFIVAAWFAWRRAKKLDASSMGVGLLLALICAIGIGSFLWHTFATGWARLADVLPILLFQLLYAWLYCRDVARTSLPVAHSIAVIYFASIFAARQLLMSVLNGSLIYAPALVFLLSVGIYHSVTYRKERFIILSALGAFVVAWCARTADLAVCGSFPLGTHFIWHTCNAVVLYLMMRGLLVNRA